MQGKCYLIPPIVVAIDQLKIMDLPDSQLFEYGYLDQQQWGTVPR